MTRGLRCGRSRLPKSTTIAIVPATSGTPASANSKNEKEPAPASSDASETITLTGVPVNVSIDPAWAANASGISSCEDGICNLSAVTTTTGISARRPHR